MDVFFGLFSLFTILSPVFVYAIPPSICFANFRWDDCGKPPKPVMYYWKPGSRCEVGIWKGCLPNPNMFTDEYDCVNTCIFTVRGSNMDALDGLRPEFYDETTPAEETMPGNVTDSTDGSQDNSTTNGSDNGDGSTTATGTKDGASTAAGSNDGSTTAAGSNDGSTTAAGSNDGSTTAAGSNDGSTTAAGSNDGSTTATGTKDGASTASGSTSEKVIDEENL